MYFTNSGIFINYVEVNVDSVQCCWVEYVGLVYCTTRFDASVVEWCVFPGQGISFFQKHSKLLMWRRIWDLLLRLFEVPHNILHCNTPGDHSESSHSSSELTLKSQSNRFILTWPDLQSSWQCVYSLNPLSSTFYIIVTLSNVMGA